VVHSNDRAMNPRKRSSQAPSPHIVKDSKAMADLLEAIVDDDRQLAARLIRERPGLTSQPITLPKLYNSKILHWIYSNDIALHLAAAGYRFEIVQALLAAGADPNSRMNHRQSGPLHYAADGYISGPAWDPKKQVKTIRCLLDAGAEKDAQDKNGASPLHRAVRTRCAGAVRCLLQAGCNPVLRNKPGSTPFHLAVQNTGHGGTGAEVAKSAQREIIKEFVLSGVSMRITDGKGQTVMECAKSDWIRTLLEKPD